MLLALVILSIIKYNTKC